MVNHHLIAPQFQYLEAIPSWSAVFLTHWVQLADVTLFNFEIFHFINFCSHLMSSAYKLSVWHMLVFPQESKLYHPIIYRDSSGISNVGRHLQP